MKINQVLKGLVELVQTAAKADNVALCYLPTPTYMGYIVIPNEVENSQIENVYYVNGLVAKHIEVGTDVNSEFNLAGKEGIKTFKNHISRIEFSKSVNFNSKSLTTRGFIASIRFKAIIEAIEEEEDKKIIKTIDYKNLRSKIGQIHINTNNVYRDNTKYNDGYLEYLLLNGQTIKKEEYPNLFNVLNEKEATYTLPNYWQEDGGCTLKHVKQGSGRGLNSYERD